MLYHSWIWEQILFHILYVYRKAIFVGNKSHLLDFRNFPALFIILPPPPPNFLCEQVPLTCLDMILGHLELTETLVDTYCWVSQVRFLASSNPY